MNEKIELRICIVSHTPSEAAGGQAGKEGRYGASYAEEHEAEKVQGGRNTPEHRDTCAGYDDYSRAEDVTKGAIASEKPQGRAKPNTPTHTSSFYRRKIRQHQGLIRARYNHSPTPPFTSQSQMMSSRPGALRSH